MNIIIAIIYGIGAIIALGIGIYEMFVYEGDKDEAQFGMIIPMILLSWVTVILYFYNKFNHKS